MNRSTRCRQPFIREFTPYVADLQTVEPLLVASPELNRLLTAAVVNRRFCRLLLTNPLRALTLGYRGEAFQLNPTELQRVSAIRATSLRDFALQLLLHEEREENQEAMYAKDCQEIALFVR